MSGAPEAGAAAAMMADQQQEAAAAPTDGVAAALVHGGNLEDLYEQPAFFMYCFKMLPCSKRTPHCWQRCPFAHHGERARRRDLRAAYYSSRFCPDARKLAGCPRGDSCSMSHNVFESWLHPERYRTQLCSSGPDCSRNICWFAHTEDELRTPTAAPQPIAAESQAVVQPGTGAGHGVQVLPDLVAAGSQLPPMLFQHQGGNMAAVGGALHPGDLLAAVPGGGMIDASVLPMAGLSVGPASGSHTAALLNMQQLQQLQQQQQQVLVCPPAAPWGSSAGLPSAGPAPYLGLQQDQQLGLAGMQPLVMPSASLAGGGAGTHPLPLSVPSLDGLLLPQPTSWPADGQRPGSAGAGHVPAPGRLHPSASAVAAAAVASAGLVAGSQLQYVLSAPLRGNP